MSDLIRETSPGHGPTFAPGFGSALPDPMPVSNLRFAHFPKPHSGVVKKGEKIEEKPKEEITIVHGKIVKKHHQKESYIKM